LYRSIREAEQYGGVAEQYGGVIFSRVKFEQDWLRLRPRRPIRRSAMGYAFQGQGHFLKTQGGSRKT